jgi:hypothetical protein
MGGVEVQLTDAFFADPKAIKTTYVLPLKITAVSGADSILSGRTDKTSPDPRKPGDWVIAPKNFTLYTVKYINPYHGFYLRRGVTAAKGTGANTTLDTTIIYHQQYVEKNQVVSLVTTALDEVSLSLNTRDTGKIDIPFRAMLKFDSQGAITISAPAAATYTVSGTGALVKKGDMWGEQKRDVLYLKYQVNFGTKIHSFTDTLVIRDRGVKFETFTPFVVN